MRGLMLGLVVGLRLGWRVGWRVGGHIRGRDAVGMGRRRGHTRLPDGECRSMAAYFQLLSNYNDLQLIAAMGNSEHTVSELAHLARISQPVATRRLALLERGGLARSRHKGKHTYYAIADPSVHALCRRVRKTVAKLQLARAATPAGGAAEARVTDDAEPN